MRQSGLNGARALSRLLVALIENLGMQDSVGRRVEPGWPRGTRLSAFGPTPLGEEIARAATSAPIAPTDWRDSVTGLPVHDEAAFAAPDLHAIAPRSAPLADPLITQTQDVPSWRRPFVAMPGVRYVRTPDHVLRRRRTLEEPLPPLTSEAVAPEDEVATPSELEAPIETEVESATDRTWDGADLEDDPVDENAILNSDEHMANDMGAPLRLRMLNGFPVDLPAAANDARRPGKQVQKKQSFAVAIRAKSKPSAAPSIPVAVEPVSTECRIAPAPNAAKSSPKRAAKPALKVEWDFPSVDLLGEPRKPEGSALTAETLEQNARLLETTLEDFGIRGEIIHVRAGPVVTLYELEPAPGMKSSRVIGLADDIARSMSALSARVAVVPGRNAIGIELPNERRETVYFREMVESEAFAGSKSKLAIALGKTIGGEPVVADLAKMPHLLVAGTTGSGKSVAINTMILSLLYRLKPEECRLIMVDPKMLELSVYDGIPHLLTPVVTDPKKAVVALKWAVREMEDRYKKMSKVGVRNIDGFNARITQAKTAGETIMMQVTTGFDRETGKPTIEEQPLDLVTLPYIVVIVDEMADLMMVAGKDIEGAIQRLAQMARAAGIHLIMATQRPSVDVITGTIKANFPTRISFQVTSKIDSRTILGEMGAEQLLGQGDMLHMQGGGRIYRVHGPFVSDEEVEHVVAHLKAQGQPAYLDCVTDEPEADDETEADDDRAVFDRTAMAGEDDGDLYEQAVRIVLRDKKSSVSYVQRRLSVGYNKAASLIERMEKEGVLGPASHTGKREILAHGRGRIITGVPDASDDE